MNNFLKKSTYAFIFIVLLSSCASRGEELHTYHNVDKTNDPLEPLNRFVFAFNQTIDFIIIEPVARLYRFITPEGFRSAANNVFSNMGEPLNAANNLLSGNFSEAGNNMFRLIVNTTYGIGGIADVASDFDLGKKPIDFGQTLATWGVDEGPYVVLPILGGYNLRDAIGVGVDYFGDPVNILVFNNVDHSYFYTTVPSGIAKREQYLDLLETMRKDSLDFYVTMREYYRQNRRTKTARQDDFSMYNFQMDSFDDEEE